MNRMERSLKQLSILLGLIVAYAGLASPVQADVVCASPVQPDVASCSPSRANTCPMGWVRTSVVKLEDFNCVAEHLNGIPDTQCWQQALDCATTGTKFGAVEATEGVTYNINDT